MSVIVADRVKETATTTGTGSLTLLGGVIGFRAFSAVCSNGDQVYYCIAAQTPGEWEVGIGTWSTGGTLSRDTVLSSSNSGSLVSFSSGTKDVFVTVPADLARFGMISISTTIPNATVLTLNTTAAAVVPGVTGAYLVPQYAVVRKVGAAAFTLGSATDFQLRWKDKTGTIAMSASGVNYWMNQSSACSTLLLGPGNGTTTLYPALSIDASPSDFGGSGQPIVAYIAGGNVSVGNSDVKVTTFYRVLTP